MALCLLVSAGFICERGAANKGPALVSRSGGGWISCGEEAGQVVKTLWKCLFCQLWCGGIHPKHPTPMAPAACRAAKIKPQISRGLFRLESASFEPKRSAEYFLPSACREWDVSEQQHISKGQEERGKATEELHKAKYCWKLQRAGDCVISVMKGLTRAGRD